MCSERLRIAILCLMLPAACTSGGGEGMGSGDNQTPIDGQAPADTTLVVDSQPTDEGEIGQDTAPICVPQPEMCDGIDNDCDTTINAAPPGRGYHTAVWTGTQMVIWGGWDQETFEFLNSGGRYTP